MVSWLNNSGKDRDVVVSSRVRLARNLSSYNFPVKMNSEDMDGVYEDVVSALKGEEFISFRIKDIPYLEKMMLVEKHVISPALIKKNEGSGFSITGDETETVMINEEDHIRIQVLDSGLSLENAWKRADELDNLLERTVEYAFNEKVGYLTACPTNLGTGMRASIMIHLPALEITRQVNNVLSTVTQFGLAVRGVYGEGTKAMGSLYQISNQITMGDREEIIVRKIENIAAQISEKERMARKYLLEKDRTGFEDRIFRAYGILKNARKISQEEAAKLLSYVKLGIDAEIIENNDINELDKLFIGIQSASIQFAERKEMNMDERDIKRATILRAEIK
jgi:protein arginine kinase